MNKLVEIRSQEFMCANVRLGFRAQGFLLAQAEEWEQRALDESRTTQRM